MPVLRFLIQTNLFISLAAVALSVETLLLVGEKPAFQPYLILVFFATLCEYNFQRLLTVLFHPQSLQSGKHEWIARHKMGFYLLVFSSIVGFGMAVLLAKPEVLFILSPFALITLLYSVPFLKYRGRWLRLRDLHFSKIFLIALVWAGVTVALPVVRAGIPVSPAVFAIFGARFFFVLGITLPFDIRDRLEDEAVGLLTLPNRLGVITSYRLAYACIIAFIGLSIMGFCDQLELVVPMVLSGIITLFVLAWPSARKHHLYHYGILDGMMVLQWLLVWAYQAGPF